MLQVKVKNFQISTLVNASWKSELNEKVNNDSKRFQSLLFDVLNASIITNSMASNDQCSIISDAHIDHKNYNDVTETVGW